MRYIFFIVLITTFLLSLSIVHPSQGELKGLWVVRDTLMDSANVIALVEDAKTFGFTDLFVQVRGAGDSYYLSKCEPRAFKLDHLPKGVDPLQMVICLTRPKGIRIHAWLNMLYASPGAGYEMKDDHILARYPSWCQEDVFSRSMWDYTRKMLAGTDTEGLYLKPEYPQVADYLSNIVIDIADRYRVDGIHLDFIRYPNIRFGYSTYACEEFKDRYGIDPRIFPQYPLVSDPLTSPARLWLYIHQLEWFHWRAERITHIVREIDRALKEKKPDVVLSAAVWFPPQHAYRYVGQDWVGWLEEGIIDIACPMAYWSSSENIARELIPLINKGYHIALGIGAWRKETEEIISDIDLSRVLNADGFILFSYGGIVENKILPIALKLREMAPFEIEGEISLLPQEYEDWTDNTEYNELLGNESIEALIELGKVYSEMDIKRELWDEVIYSERRSTDNAVLGGIPNKDGITILKGVRAIDGLVKPILQEKYKNIKDTVGSDGVLTIRDMKNWQGDVIYDIDTSISCLLISISENISF
ncbi:MAG: hypothetical protein DRH51_02265 [Candidatus Coatesbacteria bacterium]|nr:MAG: hypothetical protein DRH51_02265 [Candidatus Coatesbacteria bacterium]